MKIDGHSIQKDDTYVIAEIGVNHNGEISKALELINVASSIGADAVKFQSFVTEELVTASAPKADYQEQSSEGSQREMLKQYELTPEQHKELQEYCITKNITFISTPFEGQSLNLLEKLDVPAIKIGSGELTNLPFLEKIAEVGRPMIVSTGMSTMEEVETAVDCIKEANPMVPLALLHCVSAYPTKINSVNLRAMETMQERFDCPVGFSDHTMQVETPGLAAAMGASIIEKHLTLDRSLPGPDHKASLEPDEMERAVEIVRNADRALGSPEKRPVPAEEDTAFIARKSLHAAKKIKANEPLTRDNVEITRPKDGLEPGTYETVLGLEATSTLEPGEPITEEHLGTER